MSTPRRTARSGNAARGRRLGRWRCNGGGRLTSSMPCSLCARSEAYAVATVVETEGVGEDWRQGDHRLSRSRGERMGRRGVRLFRVRGIGLADDRGTRVGSARASMAGGCPGTACRPALVRPHRGARHLCLLLGWTPWRGAFVTTGRWRVGGSVAWSGREGVTGIAPGPRHRNGGNAPAL
jgi:hypothetical protein